MIGKQTPIQPPTLFTYEKPLFLVLTFSKMRAKFTTLLAPRLQDSESTPTQLIIASVVEQYHNDEILMRRALSESALEFESRNYGMVPAKESLVNEMLKRIKVEDEDIKVCIVCLEQLKVGAKAYRMPGSHIFHGDCIEKWLKQSHYCPICRFEMPKN
ncbi:hypothetical protein GOBAR_AA07828 [Gossypium barbadense]|uniref:RING-type E3 ubiquitin transferase n=1 Tax=Gossypium barbadense TaxID=3634 RepID=A0A2P5YB62_GOSBA|nr:hypothetical protein GOBAR_AA07828 [Gossypium barbadense]